MIERGSKLLKRVLGIKEPVSNQEQDEQVESQPVVLEELRDRQRIRPLTRDDILRHRQLRIPGVVKGQVTKETEHGRYIVDYDERDKTGSPVSRFIPRNDDESEP